ncbi:DUF2283 domain-containing protein [Aureimonas psammosilenae]|uniref:DUF2283 domain-containing protein n=1 Tax=Aureimonas psammosilenae TaxID=2495496 RepID=UPI00126119C5|nr:DUF2283 domain-containing protein [Aureimonas psammosilenae]
MRLTYDPQANAAYIRFKDERVEVETIEISASVLIDLAPDGSVYGIELLNANEQLRAGDDGNFVFTDPESGREAMLKVA